MLYRRNHKVYQNENGLCITQSILFSWNAFLPCLHWSISEVFESWWGLGTRGMGEPTHTLVQILSLHSGNVTLQIRVVELSIGMAKHVTFCFTLVRVKTIILFFPYIILSQVELKPGCLCRSSFWAYLYWQATVLCLIRSKASSGIKGSTGSEKRRWEMWTEIGSIQPALKGDGRKHHRNQKCKVYCNSESLSCFEPISSCSRCSPLYQIKTGESHRNN